MIRGRVDSAPRRNVPPMVAGMRSAAEAGIKPASARGIAPVSAPLMAPGITPLRIVETTPVTRALATPPTTAPGTAMAGPTSNAGMGEEITVETISSGVFPAI